jgi:hypothetical protein
VYSPMDFDTALEFVTRLAKDLQDPSCPPEMHQLGRTIRKWREQIANWHKAHLTNGAPDNDEQPHQENQTHRVRPDKHPPLPHTRPALRRQTQLGPTRHHHTPLKSEDPVWA